MAEVRNLRTLLQSIVENTDGDSVSIEDLLNAVGRRSYGPLFLLGFVAISPLTIVPGANWLIATIVLMFAVQLLIGRKFPWAPKRALQFSFPRSALEKGARSAEKYVFIVDQFVKPRLTFLTEFPFVIAIALVCLCAALITYPLGFFPFGPLLPSLSILVLGLGLTGRDGLMILLGLAPLAGTGVLLYNIWDKLPFI